MAILQTHPLEATFWQAVAQQTDEAEAILGEVQRLQDIAAELALAERAVLERVTALQVASAATFQDAHARIVRTDTPPEERTKYSAVKGALGAALAALITPLKESAIAHDLSAGRTRVTMEIPRRHVRMIRTWLATPAPGN